MSMTLKDMSITHTRAHTHTLRSPTCAVLSLHHGGILFVHYGGWIAHVDTIDSLAREGGGVSTQALAGYEFDYNHPGSFLFPKAVGNAASQGATVHTHSTRIDHHKFAPRGLWHMHIEKERTYGTGWEYNGGKLGYNFMFHVLEPGVRDGRRQYLCHTYSPCVGFTASLPRMDCFLFPLQNLFNRIKPLGPRST